MSTRILSISGLRGIVGDGLDPLYVTEFAAALGTILLAAVLALYWVYDRMVGIDNVKLGG